MRAHWRLVFVAASIGGCATIYTDSTQPVTVMTVCEGSTRTVKTECELSGSGWRQTIITPSVVEVNRSADRIRIDCASPEIGRGTAELEASSNFKWASNINPFNLVGTAVVGVLVDYASGASNEFPKSVTIVLRCSDLGA